MIDVETPFSPGWWLVTLHAQLHERNTSPKWSRTGERSVGRPPLNLLADYVRGEPPLASGAEAWKPGVRRALRLARMNYGLLATQSVSHRLHPSGWGTAVDDDRDGDEQATEVADENDLGLRFGEALEHMLGLGDGYFLVGQPAPGMSRALITSEDPRQVITAHDSATGRALAGLKMFTDEWTGAPVAYVYVAGTPGMVFVARAPKGSLTTTAAAARLSAKLWDFDADADGRVGQELPRQLDGRLPLVRMRNAGGVGDFEPHLNVLDLINEVLFDSLVLSKYQAFRQRGMKNLPDRDEAGQEIDYSDAFLADPGGLWRIPADVEVWEAQASDLTPLRMMVKDHVAAFAALTFTPLHYITPDAAQGSAEGASVMREGHLFRVEDRRRRADAALREVMSLAFAWEGDLERAARGKIRTLWAPIERHSLTERMSAATQAKAAGLPQASVFTDVMGYGPADLPRLEAERGKDLLFAGAAATAEAAAAAEAVRG